MKRYLLTCLAIGGTLLSCQKNVLDKVPLDIISDGQVWGDQVLIDAYLTQAYAQTYIFLNETGGNDWDTGGSWAAPFAINHISDEGRTNWPSVAGSLGYYYKLGGLTVGGGLLEWWESSYRVIRILNEFIDKMATATVEDSFRKQRLAEARFIRAFNYFAMVKRYGGVPLITKPQQVDDPHEELYPKRASEQAIYDFILSEMDAIVPDLPTQAVGGNYGRPSLYAALALKSRAALYAASIADYGQVQLDGLLGIPATMAIGYYQQAYDAAVKIILDNRFSLYDEDADKVTNFRNLFIKKNNAEVIFVCPHTFTDRDRGGNGWSYDFFQTPPPNAWGAGNVDAPYLEMAEAFEKVDGTPGTLDRNAIQQGLWTAEELWQDREPRFFATIYTLNTAWKGTRLDWHNGLITSDGTLLADGSYQGVLAKGNQQVDGSFGTGFGVMKYLDESKNNLGERGTSGTDWIIFRYGEVLLNFAEAAYALGINEEALLAINTIRQRAGVAQHSSIDLAKIKHERKVELAYEGHRYWDLRRWRTAVTDLTGGFSGLRYILDYTTGRYRIEVVDHIDGTVTPPLFRPENYYLPITPGRIGQNANLVENPGY
ncbi:RagB/SusD family nutrient uptake outer membrane protein [Parapedobacter sp. 2B3]|uniref:RagB/SusD family nutrient uptake outer membrane protein n=1 Tax=Parapedobacter sp. 2B3 TaxID=3342381 RepID=UPI0035B60513